MPDHQKRSDPDYTRAELTAVKSDLELVQDLLGGTRRMHEQSGTYIKKWKDESVEIYRLRKTIENVFEGFSRTLSAAVGQLFAKPPQVTWNGGEAEIKVHWENIDAAGTAGAVFVKRFADVAIRDGLAVLLVDHPSPPLDGEGQRVVVHSGNERAFGLRPRWALYGRANAINWRTTVINNETILSLLVLHEPTEVPDQQFGIETVDRYRVLRIEEGVATWTLFEKVTEGGQTTFAVRDAGTFQDHAGKLADRLPVAIGYAGRTDAVLTASMPLIGVAHANLAHWQQSTDLRFYRSLSAFPQPTIKGQIQELDGQGNVVPGALRIGPAVGIHLDADGEFAWVELTGSAMEQLKDGIAEKLTQMAQQGVSFLQPDTRVAETAEAKRLDATAENATLATAAQGIEDAVNLTLEHHAWYLGIGRAEAPVLTITRDFESVSLDPALMAAYIKAVEKIGLPTRLVLEVFQQGGRIPPDVDLNALEMEMLANAEARRAEREAQREAFQERTEEAA